MTYNMSLFFDTRGRGVVKELFQESKNTILTNTRERCCLIGVSRYLFQVRLIKFVLSTTNMSTILERGVV